MHVNYTGKNIDITPSLKTFAEGKLQTLEKHHHSITAMHIIFTIEKETQIAEATLHSHGAEINAKAASEDMYKSIEMLIDKLSTQLTKQKEKLTNHHR